MLASYTSAENKFLKFCSSQAIDPFPLSENHLCYFVSVLANEGLQHQTLKSYLSALRYVQIARGLPKPFADASFPRLEYVLKGVKKTWAEERRSQAMPCNNSGHPEILEVCLVSWCPQPEARPCDAVGGLLLRVLRLLEVEELQHSHRARILMLEFTCLCRKLPWIVDHHRTLYR